MQVLLASGLEGEWNRDRGGNAGGRGSAPLIKTTCEPTLCPALKNACKMVSSSHDRVHQKGLSLPRSRAAGFPVGRFCEVVR